MLAEFFALLSRIPARHMVALIALIRTIVSSGNIGDALKRATLAAAAKEAYRAPLKRARQ